MIDVIEIKKNTRRISTTRTRTYPGMEAIRILAYACTGIAVCSFLGSCFVIWYGTLLNMESPEQAQAMFMKIVITVFSLMFHSVPILLFSFVGSFIKVLLDIQDNTLKMRR